MVTCIFDCECSYTFMELKCPVLDASSFFSRVYFQSPWRCFIPTALDGDN